MKVVLADFTMWQVRLPFRMRFSHSLASRAHADSLLVRLRAAGPGLRENGYALPPQAKTPGPVEENTVLDKLSICGRQSSPDAPGAGDDPMKSDSGGIGYGQALPRAYLTGESLEGVRAAIEERWWPAFAGLAFSDRMPLDDAIATFHDIYRQADASRENAAYAAVDMAALAALANRGGVQFPLYDSRLPLVGVITAGKPRKAFWLAKIMRLCGFRRFKVKVGVDEAADRERLRAVVRAAGKDAWIAVDANAAWTAEDAERRMRDLAQTGIRLVEEPLVRAEATSENYSQLEKVTKIPIMADESLCTLADAHALLSGGNGSGGNGTGASTGPSWWNIRLAKNGGFAGVRELARLAHENGKTVYGGILVGETGALAAAGRTGMYMAGAVCGEYGFSRIFLKHDPFRGAPAGYRGAFSAPDADGGMRLTLSQSALRTILQPENVIRAD